MNKAKLHNPSSDIPQPAPTPILGFQTDMEPFDTSNMDMSISSDENRLQTEESELAFCVNQVSETIKNLQLSSVVAKKPLFNAIQTK